MSETRQGFGWRAMTSVVVTLAFLVLLITGTVLFIAPPGRIANWTNWNILGFGKHDWVDLHVVFGTLFLAAALFHVVFNWKVLVSYFKNRLSHHFALRLEWVAALALCIAVFTCTRAAWPPFSSLLAFNERIKNSWEKPAERPPIPHAELLALEELARRANVELPLALQRLNAAGVSGATPEILITKLASQNKTSGQRLYQIISTAPVGSCGSATATGETSGPGWGRKTVPEVCRVLGVDLQEAMARLQSKKIKLTEGQTLREIAEANGVERPHELLEIVRGQTATTP